MKKANITENLTGKKIIEVIYPTKEDDKYIFTSPELNIKKELEFDASYFYIVLNTGEVIEIWNSEWGGIRLFKNLKSALERRNK